MTCKFLIQPWSETCKMFSFKNPMLECYFYSILYWLNLSSNPICCLRMKGVSRMLLVLDLGDLTICDHLTLVILLCLLWFLYCPNCDVPTVSTVMFLLSLLWWFYCHHCDVSSVTTGAACCVYPMATTLFAWDALFLCQKLLIWTCLTQAVILGLVPKVSHWILNKNDSS